MVVDNENLESIMKQPIKLNEKEYRECLKEFKFEREDFIKKDDFIKTITEITIKSLCIFSPGGCGKTNEVIEYYSRIGKKCYV